MSVLAGRKGLVAAATLVLVSLAGAAWHLLPGRPGRAVALPLDGLTASGVDVRLERVGGGARLVSFGTEGVLLGLPLDREIEGQRLRLVLGDAGPLTWAGVSLWRAGEPHSDPVSMGRAFTVGSPSLDLDFTLPDGAYRAVHVELRPRGGAGRFTVESVELSPRPATPPAPGVLLSAAALLGGAVCFVGLGLAALGRLRPPQRRRAVAALLLLGVGAPLLLLGALALEDAEDAEGDAGSPLARVAGVPARVLGELRTELNHVGRQAETRGARDLRRLDMHLSPQALATLEARRQEALETGILITEAGDEVRGYLSLDDGEPVRIRTRLKGDWVDHLEGGAFSLRVRVRGQDAVLGMRRFSLQRPQTRVGHYEAIVLEQMRSEGIIAPRYDFVRFSLNGEDVGVMAVEEFMSRELLEANRRREGVILALDEDHLWRQRRLNARAGGPAEPGSGPAGVSVFEAAHRSPIRTFQEGTVLKDPVLRHQYAEAVGLLRGYLEGHLDPEDVFDVVLLGRFFAVVNLWNADHPTWWHNVRVYFNPVTRLLEPIAFDINVRLEPPPPGSPQGWLGSDFYHLRGSPRFLASYHEALGRLREEVRSGELATRILDWEAAHYARLRPGDFHDAPYPPSLMQARLDVLDRTGVERSETSRYDPGPPVVLDDDAPLVTFAHAFWVRDGEGAYIEFQNLTDRSVTVERLEYRHRRLATPVSLELAALSLPPGDRPGERVRVPVPHDPLDLDGRLVAVATLDARPPVEIEARRSFPAARAAAFRPLAREAFLAALPFVEHDPGGGYRVPEGSWEVGADALVPDDGPLLLEPGVTLRFAPGVRLVLRTPLQARGEAHRPIRLEAREGEWGGVVVLQAGGPSLLEHVEIGAIAPPAIDRWQLTGAVTFYESDVTLREVRIAGTRTEDALNVLRSEFDLRDLAVEGVPSDALDVDFGQGTIVASRFLDMGGDAIDVSGTRVEVEDTLVRGARDKALSVGEGSTFSGRRVQADDVGTGIASKDGSVAVLENSRFADVTHAAFMAYVKKREFGPARLVVRGIALERVGRKAMPVGGSTVEIDGRRAPRVELDVGRLYDTGYMAK